MRFSYNWICEYLVGKKPSPKEMAELLMFHSFEVESVEKKGQDWVIDIKVLPNRFCDCSCHLGIAREVAAIANSKFKIQNSKLQVKNQNLKKSANTLLEVEVQNRNDCPRYSAQVILDVKVGDSPKWLRDRLEVCGLKPINNIVDATNYVMLETGQPMHAFDLDKIESVELRITNYELRKKKIVVRRARKGESIKTLDKEKTAFELDEDILVIADSQKPIAIAGIKGGLDTGIEKNTKRIVIEAANFYGPLVRKASQKLKLKTDASIRFENWLDERLVEVAQNRVGQLIQQVAGGEVLEPLDVYQNKKPARFIILRPNKVNKLLGLELTEKQILAALTRLGLKTKKTKAGCKAQNIEQRLDLKLEEDLIEEIGRLNGYEKIKGQMPVLALSIPSFSQALTVEENLRDNMAANGFNEVLNYSFISKQDQETFGLSKNSIAELENPQSQLTQYLRPSLAINLLKTASLNLKYNSLVRLFEIGKVFEKTEGGVLETNVLGGIAAGRNLPKDIFFSLKGVLENVLSKVGCQNISWAKLAPADFGVLLQHKSALIMAGPKKQVIGSLGNVRPDILQKIGADFDVWLWEINIEKLLQQASPVKTYQPIAQYPAVERDLSLWLPNTLAPSEVLEIIEQETQKLKTSQESIKAIILNVDKEIAKSVNKINIVIRLSYQAQNKGLSGEDIKPKQEKIIQALEAKEGWEVRR